MPIEFDFHVSACEGLLDLTLEHLKEGIDINIINDPTNPAETIYIKLPKSETDTLNWMSKTKLNGASADLVIMYQDNLDIKNGDFGNVKDPESLSAQFRSICITDRKINQISENVVDFADDTYNKKLVIHNPRNEGLYLFGNKIFIQDSAKVSGDLFVETRGEDQQLCLIGSGDKYIISDCLKISAISSLKQICLDKVYFRHYEDINLGGGSIKVVKAHNILGRSRSWNLDSEYVSLDNFCPLADEIIVKCSNIDIGSINAPIASMILKPHNSLEFSRKIANWFCSLADLDLDLSDLKINKIAFPLINKVGEIKRCKIKGFQDLHMGSGNFGVLSLEGLKKVIIDNIQAKEVSYHQPSYGQISFNQKAFIERLFAKGNIDIYFGTQSNAIVQHFEALGLCKVMVYGDFISEVMQLNLDSKIELNNNSELYERKSVAGIDVSSGSSKKVIISNIFGKLNNFLVQGGINLGNVAIEPFVGPATALSIMLKKGATVTVDSMMIMSNYSLLVDKETGRIHLQKLDKTITSGSTFINIDALSAKKFLHVASGKSLRFNCGMVNVGEDASLVAKYYVAVSGAMAAKGNVIISSESGGILLQDSDIEARSLSLVGNDVYIEQVQIKAEQVLTYVLDSILGLKSDINSEHIQMVTEYGNTSLVNMHVLGNMRISSGGDISIENCEILSGNNAFFQAVGSFVASKMKIDIEKHPNILFGMGVGERNADTLISGGVQIAKEVSIVGMFDPYTQELRQYHEYKYHTISFENRSPEQIQMFIEQEPNTVFFDMHTGMIVGSCIKGSEQVIIRTENDIDILPIAVYNAAMLHKGFNEASVQYVISQINTGSLIIEAKGATTCVGALLKAAYGKIHTEYLSLLDTPENIANQQKRMEVLGEWIAGNDSLAKEIGKNSMCRGVPTEIDFKDTTNIYVKNGRVDVFYPYKSKHVFLRQDSGDVTFTSNQDFSKYDTFSLNIGKGKMLFTSNYMKQLYPGINFDNSKQMCIGGNNVYFEANDIVSEGCRFNARGELKLIAQNDVKIIPIEMHSLYEQYSSKGYTKEEIKRHFVNHVNAGVFEIKAGRAIEIVGGFFDAAQIKFDSESLDIISPKDIINRQVYHKSRCGFFGLSSKEKMTKSYDENVVPTTFRGENMTINVNGKTTMDAAQFFMKNMALESKEGSL